MNSSSSRFAAFAAGSGPVLTEAAVVERLRRTDGIRLDPHAAHAGLLYDPDGAAVMSTIYRQYLDIAREADLPIMLFTPTWRANPERLRRAGLDGRPVNRDAVRLLRRLRSDGREFAGRVLIGGLIGCRGDAYRPEEGLDAATAEHFHAAQLRELSENGVDFLFAATLPALPEAVGIARAMAATGVPGIISFVLDRRGLLLDGTPLDVAIEAIDRVAAPAFYLCNCCHPSFFRAGMTMLRERGPERLARVIGLEANTSALDAAELDGRKQLDADEPERFAAAMAALRRDFGIRVLGGCCGSDDRHLRALAQALRGDIGIR